MMNGIHQGFTNNDALDEFMISYRNRAWSARSWHSNKHKFCDKQQLRDFEAGYRAGYEETAAGGNGCTPTISPPNYWGWKYQSAEGQSRVSAWFEAYAMGARAAEEDGLGSFSSVRTMLPVGQTMPPAGPLPGPLPMGGAPTPAGPIAPLPKAAPMPGVPMPGVPMPGVPMLGVPISGNQSPANRPVNRINDYSDFDLSSIPKLTVGDVPTAATGRK
jgi:hypothetical protein